MARDTDALKIRKWADSGDRIDPDDSSLNPRLSRSLGWPASFSQADGNAPRREVFNQIICEMTAIAHELNTRGMLEYDERQSYTHPAVVMRPADGMIFISKRDNTPTSNRGGPPATDATNSNENANWKSVIAFVDIPDAVTPPQTATTARRGLIEIATNSEVDAGTDTSRAVTPAGVDRRIDALETSLQAWANNRFPTSAGSTVVDASTTAKGIIEIATDSEVDTGTDTARATTPAGVQRRIAALQTALQAWANGRFALAGSLTVPTATTSRRGTVELATNSEATTGTDTTRAVTPAGMNAFFLAKGKTQYHIISMLSRQTVGSLTPNGLRIFRYTDGSDLWHTIYLYNGERFISRDDDIGISYNKYSASNPLTVFSGPTTNIGEFSQDIPLTAIQDMILIFNSGGALLNSSTRIMVRLNNINNLSSDARTPAKFDLPGSTNTELQLVKSAWSFAIRAVKKAGASGLVANVYLIGAWLYLKSNYIPPGPPDANNVSLSEITL